MDKKQKFTGELIHFGSARLRVTGSGNLKSYLRSLDDVRSYTMPVIAMASSTNREPVILGNLTEQQACFEFKTTGINETFRIGKITIYIKVTASGYSQ